MSCDKNDPQGCVNLGISYKYGSGTTTDANLAKQSYQKACDLGSQEGCDLKNTIQ